jgi:hypothetical protein
VIWVTSACHVSPWDAIKRSQITQHPFFSLGGSRPKQAMRPKGVKSGSLTLPSILCAILCCLCTLQPNPDRTACLDSRNAHHPVRQGVRGTSRHTFTATGSQERKGLVWSELVPPYWLSVPRAIHSSVARNATVAPPCHLPPTRQVVWDTSRHVQHRPLQSVAWSELVPLFWASESKGRLQLRFRKERRCGSTAAVCDASGRRLDARDLVARCSVDDRRPQPRRSLVDQR